MRNKTIRIADIRIMNDYSERKWVYQKILEQMKPHDYLDSFKLNDYGYTRNDLAMTLWRVRNEWEARLISGDKYSVYIFCLSSDGDTLSQWRAYSDDGSGVSIGFKKEILDKLVANSLTFRLEPVEYYNEDMAKKKADDIRSLVQKDIDTADVSIDLVDSFMKYLRSDDYLMKNPAFKEEAEWRLVFLPEDYEEFMVCKYNISSLQYRATKNNIVGFREIDFSQYKDEIIGEIILGPKCKINPHIDLQEFLYCSGFTRGNITVKSSEATYQ